MTPDPNGAALNNIIAEATVSPQELALGMGYGLIPSLSSLV
jgi:hypothetical protein